MGPSASLFPFPKFRAFDDNGKPLAGGLLYTYAAGSGGTIPLATYFEADLNATNANPVPLDSTGQADVWLGAQPYQLILTDAQGNEMWNVDHIVAPTIYFSVGSFTSNQGFVLGNPLTTFFGVNITTAGQGIDLPPANAANSVPLGLPVYIQNQGANAFQILLHDNSTVLFNAVQPGVTVGIVLTDNSTPNGVWASITVTGNGLQSANNLSDVANPATSLANIKGVPNNTSGIIQASLNSFLSLSIANTDNQGSSGSLISLQTGTPNSACNLELADNAGTPTASIALGTAVISFGLPNPTTATTQSAGDNSTNLATTAFVKSQGYITSPLMTPLGVGSLVWAENVSGGTVTVGSTTAGGNISIRSQSAATGDTATGTWKAMQTLTNTATGLWQRTA